MSDPILINVKQSDLDRLREFLRNRLRQLVLEHQHNYDSGAIAGMMSDLRALSYMAPTDASPAPPPPPRAPTREEQDMADRKIQAAIDRKVKDEVDKMRSSYE